MTPVPFIMGLARRSPDINIDNMAMGCILKINNMELPEELLNFPYEEELDQEVPALIV